MSSELFQIMFTFRWIFAVNGFWRTFFSSWFCFGGEMHINIKNVYFWHLISSLSYIVQIEELNNKNIWCITEPQICTHLKFTKKKLFSSWNCTKKKNNVYHALFLVVMKLLLKPVLHWTHWFYVKFTLLPWNVHIVVIEMAHKIENCSKYSTTSSIS